MHKANYCVITCVDYRLQKIYSRIISHGMLDECDVISVVGCSRDLVMPAENWHKDALMRQLELSIDLHNPHNIILLDHQDCSGYAQDKIIPEGLPLDEDRRQHEEWSNKAIDVLLEKFPDRNVEAYYVQLDGEIKICG